MMSEAQSRGGVVELSAIMLAGAFALLLVESLAAMRFGVGGR